MFGVLLLTQRVGEVGRIRRLLCRKTDVVRFAHRPVKVPAGPPKVDNGFILATFGVKVYTQLSKCTLYSKDRFPA